MKFILPKYSATHSTQSPLPGTGEPMITITVDWATNQMARFIGHAAYANIICSQSGIYKVTFNIKPAEAISNVLFYTALC